MDKVPGSKFTPQVVLQWVHAAEEEPAYLVDLSTGGLSGPFVRLTPAPITATAFVHQSAPSGQNAAGSGLIIYTFASVLLRRSISGFGCVPARSFSELCSGGWMQEDRERWRSGGSDRNGKEDQGPGDVCDRVSANCIND